MITQYKDAEAEERLNQPDAEEWSADIDWPSLLQATNTSTTHSYWYMRGNTLTARLLPEEYAEYGYHFEVEFIDSLFIDGGDDFMFGCDDLEERYTDFFIVDTRQRTEDDKPAIYRTRLLKSVEPSQIHEEAGPIVEEYEEFIAKRNA